MRIRLAVVALVLVYPDRVSCLVPFGAGHVPIIARTSAHCTTSLAPHWGWMIASAEPLPVCTVTVVWCRLP